jgi:ribosomal protein L16/L10AE
MLGRREKVSPEEARRILDRAMGQYLRGEISQAELNRLQRRYRPNYRETLAGGARRLQRGTGSVKETVEAT